MADKFVLRAYCYLDRLQPQFAGFLGTVTRGDLQVEGMASLAIEMSPGSDVYKLVDIALKTANVKPGAQVVERQFGMFEIHSHSQAEVILAGETVLQRIGLKVSDRLKPKIVSQQVITKVDAYQTQLLNRMRKGSMFEAGETRFGMECAPAVYISLAANEAEKAAQINIVHVRTVGRFGRMWLSGNEANIRTAQDAAVAALESIDGKEME
jgi:ethanolamine utilization microcompartment shell protein EutL